MSETVRCFSQKTDMGKHKFMMRLSKQTPSEGLLVILSDTSWLKELRKVVVGIRTVEFMYRVLL